MGLHAKGGGYTQDNNKISNFNVSCDVKLLQIIITAQQRLQYSIFFVEALVMQGDISFRKLFIKNGFCETSDGYFIN